MKTSLIIIAIALFLGIGVVLLYGGPQLAPGERQPAPHEPLPLPALQNASSAPTKTSKAISTSSPAAASATLITGAPAIGNVNVMPIGVVAGTPTSIYVTAQITSSLLIASSVNLVRVNTPSGTVILTQLFDDGTHGDVTPGDHIYSGYTTLNEPQAGQVQLQVSAAFSGFLTRSLSPVETIAVAAPSTGTQQYSNTFYQFSYPQQYVFKVTRIVANHQLNSRGFDLYGFTHLTLVNPMSVAIDSIDVDSLPNWGGVSVSALLAGALLEEQANALPGDSVGTTTINGQSAVSAFFPSFDNGYGSTARIGSRVVTIPTAAREYIFTMTWAGAASNNQNSPVQQDFNTIINSFMAF